MKNFVKPAEVVSLTAPYDVLSGEGLLVGTLFGVATYDALSGVEVEAAIKGQIALKKAAGAGTGGAQGAAAYWNNTTKVVTAVVGSNKLIGVFAAVVADGALSAEVILLP
jgi:predicted RecA/RadA family phage recombinase